ncbi:MAG: EndoU domain-containing protein [Oligoflexus sp.]|nr:EndoU domain-containing protein [Oligoflexus sp.]
MQTTYNASLGELSPALAEMVDQKRNEITQAVPAAEAEQPGFKTSADTYDAIMKEVEGKSFLDLTEDQLMGYQEARERFVFHKGKIEEKNKTLVEKTQKLKETTAQAKTQLQAAIVSEGFDISADDLLNSNVAVQIPSFSSLPMLVTDEKYPYDEWANQAIQDLQYRLDSGFRDQFLEKALAWQVQMDHLLPIVQSRATLSREEFNAFEAAANKVNEFLFGNGPAKAGVISRDFWFNDLNLDPAIKSAIDEGIAKYNPEEARRLKIAINKFDRDIRSIMNHLKMLSALAQMYTAAENPFELSFVDKMVHGVTLLIEKAPEIAACAIENSAYGPYADFYEWHYERDFCTDEPNDKFDRAVAGISLVAEAGTLMFTGPVGAWVVDKVEAPVKMVKRLVGVLKKGAVAKDEVAQLGGLFQTLTKVDATLKVASKTERKASLKKFFGSSKVLRSESVEELEKFAKTLEKYGEKVPEWPQGMSFPTDPLHLKKHMTTNIDGLTKKGISGTHNLDEFNEAAKKYNISIVSSKPHPTVPGITEIEYKIPKSDGSGEFKIKSATKTVYDPKVISDEEMVSLGQVAAAKSYNPANLKNSYNAEAGGINFQVYSEPNGQIRNIFPSLPNE